MTIQKDFSLKQYNTFGIDVKAKFFASIMDEIMLEEILDFGKKTKNPILILGEGSNILFTKDFNGIVLQVDIKGIKTIDETNKTITIQVGAGENWDEFVNYCCENNYWGVENLSLIPGTIGSSPIQNIGAYGVEVKDTIKEVIVFNIESGQIEKLKNRECKFGYRTSIFKKEVKGKYIVLKVVFSLKKEMSPILHYGNLKNQVNTLSEISIENIRKSIIETRRSKLPDTSEIGNCGSFFKNPVILNKHVTKLLNSFPDIPIYPFNEVKKKVAAGWLIEQCGWKGFREGDVGVHSKQSLVLLNYGNASGNQILKLSESIKDSVFEKFNIKLETEVNII